MIGLKCVALILGLVFANSKVKAGCGYEVIMFRKKVEKSVFFLFFFLELPLN